jgi:hypothetical protein
MNVFGVNHITKRDFREPVTGAVGGAAVGGAAGFSLKALSGASKKGKAKQIIDTAETIMGGGDKAVKAGRRAVRPPISGKAAIAGGAVMGAAAGGVAGHKLQQRRKP